MRTWKRPRGADAPLGPVHDSHTNSATPSTWMTQTGWSPSTPSPIVTVTACAWVLRTAWAALTLPPCAVAALSASAHSRLSSAGSGLPLAGATDATAEAVWLDAGPLEAAPLEAGPVDAASLTTGWLAASSLETTVDCGDVVRVVAQPATHSTTAPTRETTPGRMAPTFSTAIRLGNPPNGSLSRQTGGVSA